MKGPLGSVLASGVGAAIEPEQRRLHQAPDSFSDRRPRGNSPLLGNPQLTALHISPAT